MPDRARSGRRRSETRSGPLPERRSCRSRTSHRRWTASVGRRRLQQRAPARPPALRAPTGESGPRRPRPWHRTASGERRLTDLAGRCCKSASERPASVVDRRPARTCRRAGIRRSRSVSISTSQPAALRVGQSKRDVVVVRVEQHEEAVVLHRLAALVDLVQRRRRPGRRRGSARSRDSIPRSVISVPSGLSQTMSLHPRPRQRATLEEVLAAEHRMRAAQLRSCAARSRAAACAPRRGSSRPTKSRCPGSTRCCCRAACGRSRRRRASSARPATAAASRGGCATGRARSAPIAGSSVSPSTPQFHERLLSLPSRLSSRLASLCL